MVKTFTWYMCMAQTKSGKSKLCLKHHIIFFDLSRCLFDYVFPLTAQTGYRCVVGVIFHSNNVMRGTSLLMFSLLLRHAEKKRLDCVNALILVCVCICLSWVSEIMRTFARRQRRVIVFPCRSPSACFSHILCLSVCANCSLDRMKIHVGLRGLLH